MRDLSKDTQQNELSEIMRAGATVALLAATAQGADWVYTKTPGTPSNAADQEETWPPLCRYGRHQSPINIVSVPPRFESNLPAARSIRPPVRLRGALALVPTQSPLLSLRTHLLIHGPPSANCHTAAPHDI